MFNGRLIGGLDFQDVNAKCESSDGFNISCDNFFFIIFDWNNDSGDRYIFTQSGVYNTFPSRFWFYVHESGLFQIRYSNSVTNPTGRITNISIFTSLNTNKLSGKKFLGARISGNNVTACLYDYDTGKSYINLIGTTAGDIAAHASISRLFLGVNPLNIAVDSGGVAFKCGSIDNTITDTEILELMQSEGTRYPVGRTINFRYDFLESGGTVMSDRSGNGHNLTLSGFASLTQGNVNNRWKTPYTNLPK